MKYFVVNGYTPPARVPKQDSDGYERLHVVPFEGETREQHIERYRSMKLEPPELGESRLLSITGIGRISLFIYGVFRPIILVAARSQRRGYLLANTLRAILTALYGKPPSEGLYGFLLELSQRPWADMDVSDLAMLIQPVAEGSLDDNLFLIGELKGGGLVLEYDELSRACSLTIGALETRRLADALLHLEYSLRQVWGFMVGSYYICHYRKERQAISRYELERRYLENRIRYDLALVSAFRGIEAILGTPNLKEHKVADHLAAVDEKFGTAFGSLPYRSWHEVFSSKKRWWNYEELIQHYLLLRNAVSAHASPSPPKVVMEDQVLEIQCLLRSMLLDILLPVEEAHENKLSKQPQRAKNTEGSRTTCG